MYVCMYIYIYIHSFTEYIYIHIYIYTVNPLSKSTDNGTDINEEGETAAGSGLNETAWKCRCIYHVVTALLTD